jgi:cytoskeleton protein RodZ
MEGLGKKLREARLARGLTLDDAYRMTKIRPNRLDAIENEDFSLFDSLTYSKAAVLIYGKFLEVDVSPYLEAFETSESVTVDGYAYLQDAPDPEPARPVTVRRRSSSPGGGGGGGGRSSFMPLIIGVVVLVVGFTVMKWVLQMQRLNPRPTPTPGTSPMATATASDKIIAPHAQPAESTTAPEPTMSALPTATATAAPAVTPAVPGPSAAEPEVRRAEPVNPKDAAVIPTPTPSPKKSPRPPRATPSASPRSTVITTPKPR